MFVDAELRFWEAVRNSDSFAADQTFDLKNNIIVPGFIDVQINGAFGVDFSNPKLTKEDVDVSMVAS